MMNKRNYANLSFFNCEMQNSSKFHYLANQIKIDKLIKVEV
jgi:hypothetical protein